MSEAVNAPSARTTLRRGADRAVYERTRVQEILDAGLIAHVGVQTPDGPL
ncbi:MAG: pyridoxamine 5'-phosphate oxidase family protein, partial [Acidimicrobiaceae bacterium]|nr:pyridoxamine 5'-phosphate oxidase family protein [Acidimicrobiaceae bacterium]